MHIESNISKRSYQVQWSGIRVSFALDVTRLKEGISRIKKGAESLGKKPIASSCLDELYGG